MDASTVSSLGYLGPIPDSKKGMKTLILDLDETLVHSQFKPVEGAHMVLPLQIEK